MWMTVCLALLISTVFLKNFQSKKIQAIANFYQLKKFALIINYPVFKFIYTTSS